MLNLCSLRWFSQEASLRSLGPCRESITPNCQMNPKDPYKPFFPLFYWSINKDNLWTISFTISSTLHLVDVDGLDESGSSVLEPPEMLFLFLSIPSCILSVQFRCSFLDTPTWAQFCLSLLWMFKSFSVSEMTAGITVWCGVIYL